MEKLSKVITIDGMNGVGKSTLSKSLAKKLSFINFSTGSVYRSLALIANRRGISPYDVNKLISTLEHMEYQHKVIDDKDIIIIDGEDVTEAIHDDKLAQFSSLMSPNRDLRNSVKVIQRNFAKDNDIVIDGRDLGVKVFPDANAKILLTATLEERASRRSKENGEPFDDVLQYFQKIDARLCKGVYVPPEDAFHIDTTRMSPDEILTDALNYCKPRIFDNFKDVLL